MHHPPFTKKKNHHHTFSFHTMISTKNTPHHIIPTKLTKQKSKSRIYILHANPHMKVKLAILPFFFSTYLALLHDCYVSLREITLSSPKLHYENPPPPTRFVLCFWDSLKTESDDTSPQMNKPSHVNYIRDNASPSTAVQRQLVTVQAVFLLWVASLLDTCMFE